VVEKTCKLTGRSSLQRRWKNAHVGGSGLGKKEKSKKVWEVLGWLDEHYSLMVVERGSGVQRGGKKGKRED